MAYPSFMNLACTFAILLFASCGQGESFSSVAQENFDSHIAYPESESSMQSEFPGQEGQGQKPPLKSGSQTARRKIIYKSRVDLVVEEFDGVSSKINELAQKVGGFIASENIAKMRGTRRSGSWIVRVPALEYASLLEDISKIGVLESQSQDAEDVTARYVDLTARISNSKRLEERILKLLERKDAQLKSIIEVENELARVRGQIEQMEGNLRVLKDQSSLATVSINVREEQDYVPPNEPSFANKVSDAWSGSLTALADFGKRFVIALASAAPWLLLFGLIGMVGYALLRLFRRGATA